MRRLLVWMGVCAVLAAPGYAEDGKAITSAIDAEIQRQEALLERLRNEGARDGAAGTRNSGAREARSAPRAPEERQLPPEIFERKRVKVRAGRFGNHPARRFHKLVLDADRDGAPELVRWVDPDSGLVVHQQADTNYDGVLDAFSDYEWGQLVRRALDRNDDGRVDIWEVYEDGVMTRREVDRDDDGTRDAFYEYAGGSLQSERHDANGDGRVDLRIRYENRVRVSSEEDVDKDGRFDLWTTYRADAGDEVVARIERDDRGDGEPDTFEHFEAEGGRALLSRREEDLDEDGEIDVVSFYRAGKIVRREIRSSDLQPGAATTDQNT